MCIRDSLESHHRVSDTNTTLSFNATTKKISSNELVFGNAKVGDFFVVTGATNSNNNGTFQIVTLGTGGETGNTVVVDRDLTTESSTASCKVQSNIKGALGLNLRASTNSATGTIKKGDYLQIQSTSNTTANPEQLVLVVEDATLTTDSGKDFYSVQIEPKLRSDFTAGNYAVFTNPKGLFRLVTSETSWSADNVSNYGIAFSCIEVV